MRGRQRRWSRSPPTIVARCSPTATRRSTRSTRSRAEAPPQRLAASPSRRAPVARLRAAARAATSPRRPATLVPATAERGACGASARGSADASTATRSSPRSLVERGDLAGARRALERRPDAGDGSRRGALLAAGAQLAAARGRGALTRRRSPPPTSSRARYGARTRTRAVAVALAEGARRSTRLGRTRRGARAGARRSWQLARALGRAGHARPGAARARHARAARTALGARSRRPSRCSSGSLARLELAKALAALGRRAAARAAARATRASRCAARSSSPRRATRRASPTHVRTELYAAGARPRTDALAGVGALTASERRVADLAATGETEPRHRPGAVRDAQDRRGPPLQRLPQARHPLRAASWPERARERA